MKLLFLIFIILLSTAHGARKTKAKKKATCPPLFICNGTYYRFLMVYKKSPCHIGPLAKCVYIKDLKEYCFNIKDEDCFPHIVPPHGFSPGDGNTTNTKQSKAYKPSDTYTKVYSSTYTSSSSYSQTFSEYSSNGYPLTNLYLNTDIYKGHIVVGGLQAQFYGSTLGSIQGGTQNEDLGEPVHIGPLGVGDRITEAYARRGEYLTSLSFRITYLDGSGKDIKAGSSFGMPVDMTPLVSTYGKCVLTSITGYYRKYNPTLLSMLSYKWNCEGVPSS